VSLILFGVSPCPTKIKDTVLDALNW
jgi:hypothetical protein